MTTSNVVHVIPLPKGSYAIAHIQSRIYTMHTGIMHSSRYYVVKVLRADRDGRVKSFTDTPQSDAPHGMRGVTIYSFPREHLEAGKILFARQAIDFTGYANKEHLRLALVNAGARKCAG